MLRLNPEITDRIRAHGADTYPYECCGALLGRDTEGGREVQDLVRLVNRRDDSPRNRFGVSAADVRDAEKAARERGFELIGWYHSHPDHPALPSEYDREQAWPWYSYVIVSVEKGVAGPMMSWRLTDDRMGFKPEPIEGVARATV